jgi:hypothetical protein
MEGVFGIMSKTMKMLLENAGLNPDDFLDESEEIDESTPEQWELADKALSAGIKHPIFSRITSAYKEFEEALKEGKVRNDRLKKVGVGRTEAPTFLMSAMEPLDELATEAKKIVALVEKKMGEKVKR